MRAIRFSIYEKFALILFVLAIVGILVYNHYSLTQLEKEVLQEKLDIAFSDPIEIDHRTKLTVNSKTQTGSSGFKPEYFPFNPNHINKDSLLLLGFPKKTADNLIKYRKNGGVFFKPMDLKKIYGLSENQFNLLKQYIRIPEYSKKNEMNVDKKQVKKEFSNYDSPDKKEKKKVKIPVNGASTVQYEELYGIGKILSERIVKYRSALGGFYEIDQISEVYGVEDSVYLGIKDQLFLDSLKINKLKINAVSFKELLKHPYSDYETTKLITNYRKIHGPFSSIEDLKRIYTLPIDKIEKLAPYLDYSE